MKIKVREASGQVLDWMVAKCEGVTDTEWEFQCALGGTYDYSTDWAQGGPIIEQGHVAVSPALLVGTSETGRDVCQVVGWKASKDYNAHLCRYRFEASGPTPLIAAMRCYVASKLGEEVGIPEELV